jgi:hypothetical protein
MRITIYESRGCVVVVIGDLKKELRDGNMSIKAYHMEYLRAAE